MDNLPINILDLVLIAILLVSAVLAFFRGLVHEILSVLGWAGAGLLTLYLFPKALPFAQAYIANPLGASITTGAVLFIGTLIVLTLVSHAISGRIRESRLGALDRSLGFVYGLVRGAVIACIGYLLLAWLLEPPQPRWFTEARTRPVLEWGGQLLWKLLPGTPRYPGEPKRAEAPGRDGSTDSTLKTGYKPAERLDATVRVESAAFVSTATRAL